MLPSSPSCYIIYHSNSNMAHNPKITLPGINSLLSTPNTWHPLAQGRQLAPSEGAFSRPNVRLNEPSHCSGIAVDRTPNTRNGKRKRDSSRQHGAHLSILFGRKLNADGRLEPGVPQGRSQISLVPRPDVS